MMALGLRFAVFGFLVGGCAFAGLFGLGCASGGTVPSELFERSERARVAAELRARRADDLNRRLIVNAASVAPARPAVSASAVASPAAEPTPSKTQVQHPNVPGWNQIGYESGTVGSPYLIPRPADWGMDPREIARPGTTHGSCSPRDTILIWNKNSGVRMDVKVTFQNGLGQTLTAYPEVLVPEYGYAAVCPPPLREIGVHATAWHVHYDARYCADQPDGTCVEIPVERQADSRVSFRPYADAPYVLGAEMPW